MKISLYALLTTFVLGIWACDPDDKRVDPGSGIPPTGTTTPTGEAGVVTEIGQPIGAPVTKTVGPAGGTLTTPDGKLAVTIPAGALDKETNVTLQLVTNQAPGGAGPGFELLPKDTKLKKPVELTWHYTPEELRGSTPEVAGFAIQDAQRIWKGRVNVEVDPAKQTIKTRASNFAHPMAWYEQYFMGPEAVTIFPAGYSRLSVRFVPGRTDKDNTTAVGDDLEIPMPAGRVLEKSEIKNWQVNGVTQRGGAQPDPIYGHFTPIEKGAEGLYYAPHNVPPNPMVAVSVDLNLKQKGLIRLVSNITIKNDDNYFSINGKRYKNPYVTMEAVDGHLFVVLTDPASATSKNPIKLSASISGFSGKGAYAAAKDGKVIISGQSGDGSYLQQWTDQGAPPVTHYGPVTVTISEYFGYDMPVTGTISGTLHQTTGSGKTFEHKEIGIDARFRVANWSQQGG